MNYNNTTKARTSGGRAVTSFVARTPQQIRLLGSPLRQALIDTLVSSGPCTVPDLARMIGRPLDRLYYHLRLLENAGLVATRNVKSGVGRRDTEFDVPGRPVYVRYEPASAANRRAVGAVVSSLWRAARRDFSRALTDPSATVAGPTRNLWSGRVQGRVSKTDIAAINRCLNEIVDIVTGGRAAKQAGTLHQITWSFSPSRPV